MTDEADRLAWCRRQLVAAAQLLAIEPEKHTEAFPEFVHVPDELRLVWGHAFHLAGQVLEAGMISSDAFQMAASLDQEINAIPVEPHYLSALDAIASSPEWASLRQHAGELVLELGSRIEPPDLGSSYVQ